MSDNTDVDIVNIRCTYCKAEDFDIVTPTAFGVVLLKFDVVLLKVALNVFNVAIGMAYRPSGTSQSEELVFRELCRQIELMVKAALFKGEVPTQDIRLLSAECSHPQRSLLLVSARKDFWPDVQAVEERVQGLDSITSYEIGAITAPYSKR